MNGATPEASLDARILTRMAGFTAFLRGRSLPVGVGAELDLGQSLRHVGFLDRSAFLEACRATLAKSPAELRIVDDAFDAYWSMEVQQASDDALPPVATAPRPPTADGRPSDRRMPRASSRIPARPSPASLGVYSPDAPPPGHILTPLPERTLLALRTGARRLRRWSASLPGRRWKSARRGSIDFLATERASLRHGGEWVAFRREQRKLYRAEFLILWDVSGSMREHDDSFFGIVYALRRVAPRSRVFAFSTTLEEITGRLRGYAYLRALDAILPILDAAEGGTQIGACLSSFREHYGSLVRPWTTVVLLSDGWDLEEAASLRREIAWLRHHAHALVWVNPYAARPGFEPATAALRTALPYMDLLVGPEDLTSRESFRNRTIPSGLATDLTKRFIRHTL